MRNHPMASLHMAVVTMVTLGLVNPARGVDYMRLNAGNYQEYAAWSRDGSLLALCESWYRITNPHCCEAGVRLGVVAWGQLNFLTADSDGSFVSHPSFTPDGSIVFAAGSFLYDTAVEDLFLMSVAGGGARLTSHPGIDRDPAVSPDGTLVAFTSDRSGNFDVWVLAIAGGAPVQLTSHPGFDGDPAWSPDGNRIAFTSDRGGNQDIWVVSASGGEATALTTNPARDFDATWSPDGELLAFTSDRSGNQDLWVVRLSNRAESQVTTDPAADNQPAWAPDGDRIAFTSERSTYRHIWIASNLRTVNVEAVSWSALKGLYR